MTSIREVVHELAVQVAPSLWLLVFLTAMERYFKSRNGGDFDG
jgi:hypothetical protein